MIVLIITEMFIVNFKITLCPKRAGHNLFSERQGPLLSDFFSLITNEKHLVFHNLNFSEKDISISVFASLAKHFMKRGWKSTHLNYVAIKQIWIHFRYNKELWDILCKQHG